MATTTLAPRTPVQIDLPDDPFHGRSGVVVEWEEYIGPDRRAVEFEWSIAEYVLGLAVRKTPDFPFVRFYAVAELKDASMATHVTHIEGPDSAGHYEWSCCCGANATGCEAFEVVAMATQHGPLAADSMIPVDEDE